MAKGNPQAKKAMKLARSAGISLKEAWRRVKHGGGGGGGGSPKKSHSGGSHMAKGNGNGGGARRGGRSLLVMAGLAGSAAVALGLGNTRSVSGLPANVREAMRKKQSGLDNLAANLQVAATNVRSAAIVAAPAVVAATIAVVITPRPGKRMGLVGRVGQKIKRTITG